MRKLKTGLKLAVATVALVAGFDAAAQTYPSRPVKIIVPATTGGAIDVIARVLADKMTASLGQPVVVENKPGASNNLGTDFVAKSAPDGYTLVIVAASHGTNKHLFKNLGWDPVKDFEPIVYTHVVPLLLTVHPSVPAKTVPELVAWIKANPDKAICAHSGTGSSLHMATELFMSMTGTKMTLVPYKGSSAAHPDLLAGRTMMIFDTITAISPHVKAGSLRGIAVTTTARSGMFPDIPTIAESGLPGYEAVSWFGIAAPAGTPRPILERLAADTAAIVSRPDFKAKFVGAGMEMISSTPDAMTEMIRVGIPRWTEVMRDAGIQPE